MNQVYIVVDNPKKWPFESSAIPIISAREYLTDKTYSEAKKIQILNFCKSYRYQTNGYYVSLLAAARGHRPLPTIETIEDMKSLSISRLMAGDLDDLIQQSFKSIQSPQFTLSIYFGRNLAKKYDRLCKPLFNLFPCPFLRAEFRKNGDEWSLHNIRPITVYDISQEHYPFLHESVSEYLSKMSNRISKRKVPQYDLAILVNSTDTNSPSNEKAIRKFILAGRREGFGVELIDKDDFGRLREFDALFIRETTQVNHHTYRFSRFAEAEGLVVIDDPHSIRVCTNKVYLSELLARHQVPHPKTLIVHRDNKHLIPEEIGFPCILKKPDSSFSQGVYKAENQEILDKFLETLLSESDLIIAQEFVPTDFDWRVGILNRKPLYVCKYFYGRKTLANPKKRTGWQF